MRVIFVVGTRPEIIKISPIVKALQQQKDAARPIGCRVIATGQHGALADQAFCDVGIAPDIRLAMESGALGLTQSAAQILTAIGAHKDSHRKSLIMVQGDTNSALAGAMAGFYGGIAVAHVEAGLRTGDARDPFPEEANRRLIAKLAQLHFAPTPLAADNLRREGIADGMVAVTGNTIVDALMAMNDAPCGHPLVNTLKPAQTLVTATCHRRENWGARLGQICTALSGLAAHREDIAIAFPLHGNPAVADQVKALLSGKSGIHLLPPLPFSAFLSLLKASALVITDSGGVQEEAVSLGRPVLVCRASSERPEGLECGLMEIVGADPASIIRRARHWLQTTRTARLPSVNPYGDGAATRRIIEALDRWRAGVQPLLPIERQFGIRIREPA